MSFFDSFLDEVLQKEEGDDDGCPTSTPGSPTCTLEHLAEWLAGSTHSSSFSGVAAPETAVLGLHWAVQNRIPDRTIAPPRMLSMVEWNAECQAELDVLATGIKQDWCCCFSDISSFFRCELKEVIEQLKKKPSMALEVLSPIITSRQAVNRRAPCVRHGQNCFIETAQKHFCGTSCTAHSRQGKQLGLSDPNVLHLLAWAALRLEVQEQEITLENVEGFPTSVLERLLGSCYIIEDVVMDPRMYGFLCCKRFQTYKT